jgi:EmrB/QacA subfamily drug resistance transporter
MEVAARRWVFVAALATVFMAAIEGTIVATAMPTIVGALGGFELLSWVFTSYLLTQAVTIPIYGRLADLYGRRRILFIGIGLFLAGSVLCGLARSMLALVIFRVLQGLGAGAVMPVAQTLIGDIYQGEERARIQGYISGTFGAAALLGPVVGAFLVAHASWPMVFWINVPLGVLATILLALALHEEVQHRPHRIDYLGSVLMMLGTGVLMIALVEAARLSALALTALIAAALVLLATFLLYERRTPEPMLPMRLWRNRIVAGSNVANLAFGAVMMAVAAFLPAYMQGVMGSGVLMAGFVLMAMSANWSFGGFMSGRILLRFSYRTAAIAGSLTLAAGCFMMLGLDPARGALWAVVSAMLMGLGMGLTNNCLLVAIQASVPWSERGVATSSTIFTRILGQSIGTAGFGGILNAGLAGHLAQGGDLVNRIMEPSLRRTIPSAEIAAVMDAFANALHNVFLIDCLLALVVVGTAFAVPAGLGLVHRAREPR